jgi:hypothetical protein
VQIVFYKLIAALACLAAVGVSVAVSAWRPTLLSVRRGVWEMPLFWIAARLLPWWLVYFLSGFSPQSDLLTCFWPQAVGALSGKIPYRDFESFFSPLFPYLLAPPVALWRDPRVLVLWLSFFEAVTIRQTARAAGLGEPSRERTLFYACAFFGPAPMLFSVIGAQEDFLIWTVLLGVWSALQAAKSERVAVWVAAGLLATKPLFILPAAAALGAVPRPLRFLGVLAPIALATLVILRLLTGNAFLMTLQQGATVSPPNVWIWLHWVSHGLVPPGGSLSAFGVLLLLLGTALAGGFWWRKNTDRSFLSFAAGWVLLGSLLLLLSPKSLVAYFGYFALPALALAVVRRRGVLAWLLFGVLAMVESSLWYRLGEPIPSGILSLGSPWLVLEMTLQTLLLGTLCYFAWSALRTLRSSRPALPPP